MLPRLSSGLAVSATACASSSHTTKRLGAGSACGLSSTADLSGLVGSPVTTPAASGSHCQYSSANHVLTTVSRGLPSARGGTSLTIDGVPAAQTEVANGRGCVVDVALVDDDPDQLSSVSMLLGPNTPSALHTKACDLTDKVAGRIVEKLPD